MQLLPGPPQEVSVEPLSDTELKIKWVPPHQDIPIEKYNISIKLVRELSDLQEMESGMADQKKMSKMPEVKKLGVSSSVKSLMRVLFSDEAHFWLNGYVNKQNCRIWSEANPQVYVETPLHPEKLTVWCALWAGGIIGPYFFKNDEGHNVTVNGDRYRAMITNFFILELNNHDVQELGFQQDGATCHTARATIDLLKDTLGDHLISRFGPVNWPQDLVI
ncbi:uncharacterized protein TNCV_3048351 [Trichonephila clavipes]|nr:uncharacterized protein TNCV_3048351 [Trichonephila clavipes]